MIVLSFSAALRERTWGSHGDSEGAEFMTDLMKGRGTREDYIALVAQHYFVYQALEAAAARFSDDPEVVPFLSPALTRMPALEADLEFLLGDDWRARIAPLPTAVRYVERIDSIAADGWAGGFVAHHYTRYLGDLSGGQQSARSCSGISVSRPTASASTSSTRSRIRRVQDTYRHELDAAAWDAAQQERVIDEVLLAYRLNTELFTDLAKAKAAA